MTLVEIKSNNKLLNGLALHNLIGGSLGLLIVGHTSVISLINGHFAWGTLYFIGAYAISIISYFALQRYSNALWLGIYAILQLPEVTYAGLKYSLSNGVWFTIGLKAPAILATKFELYTIKFDFSLENNEPTFFGINIVAIATLFYIIFFHKLSYKTQDV